jgi:DNA-directed RNA polymerase II subunit RPB1
MSGLSENIMLGQFCPLGTGEFGLHLNEDMLKDAVDLDLEQLGAQQGTGWSGGVGMTPARGTTPGPGSMSPSFLLSVGGLYKCVVLLHNFSATRCSMETE